MQIDRNLTATVATQIAMKFPSQKFGSNGQRQKLCVKSGLRSVPVSNRDAT